MKDNKAIQRNILLIYMFEFFKNMFLISAVLIPFFRDWGGLSQTQLQTIQSVFMIAIFLFELPTGIIADRYGRKISLILGSIAWIVGLSLYLFNPSLMLFVICEIILALGAALISGANRAILYDSLKQLNLESHSQKVFSNAQSFKLVGIMIAGMIGSFFSKYLAVNIIAFLTVIPMGLATLSLLFIKEPKISSKSEVTTWKEIFTKGVKAVISDKKIKSMMIDMILVSILGYYVIWLYQLKLKEAGVLIYHFGYFVVLLSVSQIIVLQISKHFENSKNYLVYSIIPTVVGFILLALYSQWWSVAIFLILSGGFGLTRRTYYSAIMNKSIESSERATVNSVINMFRTLTIAIVNPFVGMLVDVDLDMTLVGIGLIGVVGLVYSRYVVGRITG